MIHMAGTEVRTVYSRHHESDLRRVGSTCEMGVYLLCLMLIEGDESVQDVVACRSVIRATFSNIRLLMLATPSAVLVQLAFIVREIVLHRRHRKFLLESVDLVQEKNNRGLDEPPGIAD